MLFEQLRVGNIENGQSAVGGGAGEMAVCGVERDPNDRQGVAQITLRNVVVSMSQRRTEPSSLGCRQNFSVG